MQAQAAVLTHRARGRQQALQNYFLLRWLPAEMLLGLHCRPPSGRCSSDWRSGRRNRAEVEQPLPVFLSYLGASSVTGLACGAEELCQGCKVTVFEGSRNAGGKVLSPGDM